MALRADTHKDAHGRVTEVARYLGNGTQAGGTPNRVRMCYDLQDHLLEIKDEPGNVWAYTYDSLGRRLSANDPDHGLWTFQYDVAGRLTQQQDANGAVSLFAYDGLGRHVQRTHRPSGSTVATETHLYRYDFVLTASGGTNCPNGAGFANGSKLCRTETTTASASGAIATDHNHDGNGHRIEDRWLLGGTTSSMTQARDASGQVIAKAWSDGDAVGSSTTPWTYDGCGRLYAIPGHITSLAYNARGQVTQAVYANGVTTTNTYNDARGWLMRVATVKGATVHQDIAFTRDAVGRILTVTSAGRPNDSWTYSYDSLDRLLTSTNAGIAALSNTFACDSAHNMLSNSQIGSYAQNPMFLKPSTVSHR